MLQSTYKILFLVAAVLLMPCNIAMAQSPNISGTWTGRVAQNIGSSDYTIILTVSSKGPDIHNAQTSYPELNCGGKLTRIGASKGYVFYTETITRGGQDSGGSCINGTVTMAMAGEKLAWGWFGSYGGQIYVAWSNLVRK